MRAPGSQSGAGRWHRAPLLANLPGMPGDAKSVRRAAARRGWTCREVPWGKRTVVEWLESSLPEITQAALRELRGEPAGAPPGPPADGPAPAQAGPSILTCSKLDARLAVLEAFQAAYREGGGPLVPALKQWCAIYKDSGAGVRDEVRAAIPTVAWNTLQRWLGALNRDGHTALASGRGGRISAIDADPELAEFVEAKIRANPRHVTARHIQEAVEARHGVRLSISQVRRWARAWRRDHGFALSSGEPDHHRNRTMPAFGSMRERVQALNALWELDSTRIDVMCADGKRYALVAAIDVWSARAKVLVTPESHSLAIGALIRRCMIAWGAPEWVSTDQGMEYVSKYTRRVLADFGIGHIPQKPFQPDQKPFVERFIGTLSRQFLAELPGFTGHNVAQAQALRDRKSFAGRRGDDYVTTFRADLTAEELQRELDRWIEYVYERREHGGLDGMSPFEKAHSWAGPRRPVTDERSLDILLAPAAGKGRSKVGRDGIRVEGGVYIAAELGHHMGAWVHCRRDLRDRSLIYVFTNRDEGPAEKRGRFICVARDLAGAERQEVAAAAKTNWRRKSSASRKRTRDLDRKHKPRETIFEVLDHAEEKASSVVAFPARGAEHRTPAMDAAAEAEEAAQRAAQADDDAIAGRPSATISLFQKFYGET